MSSRPYAQHRSALYPRAKQPRRLEFQTQCTLIQWLAYEEKNHPEIRWLYAIPNGGKRHKAIAGQMKAMGVKAGVWDLCLPVPRGRYHGLYIEMKTMDGELTPAQRDFGMFLDGVGYATRVCRTAPEARDKILAYLNLPKPEEKTDARIRPDEIPAPTA